MSFMKTGYKYFKPLVKKPANFCYESWDKTDILTEKWEYRKAMQEILKFFAKDVKKYQVSEFVYRIPHEKIFLDVDFSGENIEISADFLDISEANKTPLLRRILEINFNNWLPLIVLEWEKLVFKYSCPLDLFENINISRVLEDICLTATYRVDEFCEEFWAKVVWKPELEEYSVEEQEKFYETFMEIIDKNLEIISDLEKERQNSFAWDVLSTTYKMLFYVTDVKWLIRLRIRDKINELYDKQLPFETIVFNWKEFLRELRKTSKEDFVKNIYKVNTFFTFGFISTNEDVANYLRPGQTDALWIYQEGKKIFSYVMNMHILYNSMYYKEMWKNMKTEIERVIKIGSGSAPEKVAWILCESVAGVVQLRYVSEDKGFGGKILDFILSIFVSR